MLNSAYIAFYTEVGGSWDGSGNPISPTKTLSTKALCNYQTIKREYKVLVDGQYVNAKYSIYIDDLDIIPTGVDLKTVKEVVLYQLNDVVMGTYLIHNREFLSKFYKTKLIVL